MKVQTIKAPRLCQGDVLRDVECIEYAVERLGNIEISKINFPLVVVLTQDCDLAQDYTFRSAEQEKETQDKYLLSVLVAPLYNVEHVYRGEHLTEINMKMATINRAKSPGENLRKNETPRYHYLEFPEDIPAPNCVIDFKHYFAVNVSHLKDLKATNFVCQISELYREDMSQRFASFLSRIGLP